MATLSHCSHPRCHNVHPHPKYHLFCPRAHCLNAVLSRLPLADCAGMTKVNELASKHAKARAPSTTHDSSTEWQKQEQGEKGDVDSWEGDLLVLAVGNAQQAGGPRNHLFTSVMQLRDLLCPKCVSRGFRLLLTLGSCGVQLIASCMMLKHPICREVFPLLCALHFAAPCALVPQLHANNNCRHWHLSKYLACMAYTC